jgi:hypothetical protein
LYHKRRRNPVEIEEQREEDCIISDVETHENKIPDDQQLLTELEILQTMEKDSDEPVSETSSTYLPENDSESYVESDYASDDDGLHEEYDYEKTDIHIVLSKVQLTIVSFLLLLSLSDHCPQCGSKCRVTDIKALKGFAPPYTTSVLGYFLTRMFGESHLSANGRFMYYHDSCCCFLMWYEGTHR